MFVSTVTAQPAILFHTPMPSFVPFLVSNMWIIFFILYLWLRCNNNNIGCLPDYSHILENVLGNKRHTNASQIITIQWEKKTRPDSISNPHLVHSAICYACIDVWITTQIAEICVYFVFNAVCSSLHIWLTSGNCLTEHPPHVCCRISSKA